MGAGGRFVNVFLIKRNDPDLGKKKVNIFPHKATNTHTQWKAELKS